MNFINEYDRVKKYIIGNIAQLPAAYLLEDYNQMIQLWDGLSVTKEMDDQLKETRQKTISADIIIKLNEIIKAFNKNEKLNKINPALKKSITSTIEESKKYIDFNSTNTYKLYIDYDFNTNSANTGLYDENQFISEIASKIDFSSILGVLHTEKWDEILNFFEGIIIGEEVFIQEFQYAFKLQSYNQFYKVLNDLKLFIPRNKVLPKGMKLIIGEHDQYVFEFVVK
ncbi:MAG: hypothetical protein IPO26_17605 [Saprospiraceae bacterium]|nr:hypothetical protein [Saprospiraceae bacterium]MBK8828446.1 hypothetical protein [Saprospiraceae bacterium]MBK9583596.1 hypothetical protein [Saprospiraceae bacterium]